MSRSEPLLSNAADTAAGGSGNDQDVSRLVATLEQLAEAGTLSAEQVRAVVSAAVRLYATTSERAGQELPPVTHDISTTDALTLACALVRSQDLTPFEMAVWFSRGR
jgi:hypothetical protein